MSTEQQKWGLSDVIANRNRIFILGEGARQVGAETHYTRGVLISYMTQVIDLYRFMVEGAEGIRMGEASFHRTSTGRLMLDCDRSAVPHKIVNVKCMVPASVEGNFLVRPIKKADANQSYILTELMGQLGLDMNPGNPLHGQLKDIVFLKRIGIAYMPGLGEGPSGVGGDMWQRV